MENKEHELDPNEIGAKTVIKNNSFVGVKWDEPALETLHVIARALLNMTEVFRSSNVQIDSMLKINGDNQSANKESFWDKVILNQDKTNTTL